MQVESLQPRGLVCNLIFAVVFVDSLPMGFGKLRFQILVRRESGNARDSRGTMPCFAAQIPQSCALSASSKFSKYAEAVAASNCSSVKSFRYVQSVAAAAAPPPSPERFCRINTHCQNKLDIEMPDCKSLASRELRRQVALQLPEGAHQNSLQHLEYILQENGR